jgi:excinuclease ABC subunit C
MVDGSGLLMYMGKAKCLRSRLLSYFRPRSRDPKAGRILSQTRTIVWEYACHEFAALLRELDLIRRWQPRLNVQRQPKRRQRGYLCLGRTPAPYLFLSRKPGPSASVFGPIPSVDKAREAVRYLNDWFRLRDCTQTQPLYFSDQAPLFPEARKAGCLRYEIGTCLGPCIGASSWAGYQAKVRAARAFLNGTDRALLEALHQEMNQAAAVQAYERAASLRDQYDAIHWLWGRLEFLRNAREKHSFIYPVPTQQGQVVWFLIHEGQVQATVSPSGCKDLQSKIETVYQSKNKTRPHRALEDVEEVLLVTAWFRRYPQERSRTLDPAKAGWEDTFELGSEKP